MNNIRFISAGAGSGKTYSLMEELTTLLISGEKPVRPEAVIATTFTIRAANELKERVQEKLLKNDDPQPHLAQRMESALLGTVNSVCGKLLKRFSFELGLSPELEVIPENDVAALFHRALDETLDPERVATMNRLERRFQINSRNSDGDWRADVKRVVETARANNIDPQTLATMGIKNADRFLGFCDKPSDRINVQTLTGMLESALKSIDSATDKTQATRKFIDDGRASLVRLNNNSWSWKIWASLANLKVGAKSRDKVEQLAEYALEFDKCPQFDLDVRSYIESIFAIAADALDTFQQLKARLGLIDFVDQERELLRALELPEVCDVLREELDLLMVDEFQDTSPIQLALFLRLSGLARHVIWVGDIKQAIYGFRGSDPDLMLAVVDALKAGGMAIETLEHSWRSRPELVSLVNQVFVPAFAKKLDEEQVALNFPESKGSIKWDSPAFHLWALNSRNDKGRSTNETQANDVAAGVLDLLGSNHTVVDKATGEHRPLQLKDIAILCRSHAAVDQIATALEAFGLAVNRKRKGLLKTPEAVLIQAALRVLVNPRATLPRAELISLISGPDISTWLTPRLEAVASDDFSQDRLAGLHHPLIDQVLSLQKVSRFTTPRETLRRLLWVIDARGLAIGWGGNLVQVQQRLLNLDALLELAGEYEQFCSQQNAACNLAGLLFWLQDKSSQELDEQALLSEVDAVNVMTHHAAKGLEWPVVVCHGYEGKLRGDLWGLHSLTLGDFDINNPLANRFLHFWVPPSPWHGDKFGFYQRAIEDPYGSSQLASIAYEQQRLVYVSITRARDMLVLPLKATNVGGEKAIPWLDNVGARWLACAGDQLALPDGSSISAVFKEQVAGQLPIMIVAEDYQWFASRDSVEFPAKRINPSRQDAGNAITFVAESYGEMIKLPVDIESSERGNALHRAIAYQLVQGDEGGGVELAPIAELLKDHDMSDLAASDVAAAGNAFNSWLQQRWPGATRFVEYPIEVRFENGQQLSGVIDLLIETSDGWIVVDHKTTQANENALPDIAKQYAGQLAAYSDAINKLSEKPVIESWINFIAMGAMVRVDVN